MVLSTRLQIKQTQSLVITPQLLQAIRLLQMSSVELEAFVATEVEQNPLLQQDEPDSGDVARAPDDADEALNPSLEACAEIDAAAGDLFPEQVGADAGPSAQPGIPLSAGPANWEDLDRDPGVAAPESLEALLERRFETAFSHAPSDRLIALGLLAGLDETGYLLVTLDEVAGRLGASLHAIERVLRQCQDLAPTGVFARTLAECLALQLAERDRLDPAMQLLLSNLHYLAARDWPRLSALCGVDRADLAEMVAEIRALDPKPGLAFHHEPARVVVPDVFVREGPDGAWTVELNDAALPRLIVDRVYCAEVSAKCSVEADRRYMADCLQKASWLEKSLDQRARTVLSVAAEVVRRQERFLAEGIGYLKPLNLRMVADALGIHESTVSRAAAHKTLATPRGVFDFRTFFSGSLPATAGGEAHAAEAVKHRLRKLIMEEAPEAILSDDAIVSQLSREGVEIARRTVAKYREGMGIGSSVERRRQKRLKAAS